MSTVRIVLVGAFVLFSAVWLSNACKCAPRPREHIYNSSEFVSHVRILNRTEDKIGKWDHIVYELEHLKVYKPSGAEAESISDQAWTSNSDAACGIPDLQVGSEYIMSGYINNENSNHLSIGRCGSHEEVINGTIHEEVITNGTIKEGIVVIEHDETLKLLLDA